MALPQLTASTSPRVGGDGMDSEALFSSPLLTSSPMKRHSNLTHSPKAAIVTREPSPKYVPHEPVKGAVKAVKSVPIYNAPGGLSYSTYESLNTAKTLQPPEETITTNPPPDEEREVEGQSARSDAEVKDLKEQVEALEQNLGVQIKVNADLKKLLVASVGDDLHHKVESLVRTKAHLATEIGGYAEKIDKDYESIDDLAIQADKWRSKYMAGRLLISQVSQERDDLKKGNEVTKSAVRQLLDERNVMHSYLLEMHRYLKLLNDAFDPTALKMPPKVIPDDLDLAKVNLSLSKDVKFRLLANLPILPVALDAGVQNSPTPAEKYAFQALSSASQPTLSTVQPTMETDFSRFHPRVRYENITFNCCKKCKGEIFVV